MVTLKFRRYKMSTVRKDKILFDALVSLLRETKWTDPIMVMMAKAIESDDRISIPFMVVLREASDMIEAIEYVRQELTAPEDTLKELLEDDYE